MTGLSLAFLVVLIVPLAATSLRWKGPESTP